MRRLSLASLVAGVAAGALLATPTPALADVQTEVDKTINVVGIKAAFAFVAVNSPGPSAHPTCLVSLMQMPLTTLGLQQYETLRDAKIAGKAVTISFDDVTDDCDVIQVQLQQD